MAIGRPACLLALLITGLCGCFSPEYGPDPFSCVASERCPEGYRCIEGVCRTGAIPDGSGGDGSWPDLLPPDLHRMDGPESDSPLPKDIGVAPPGSWATIKAGTFTMGDTTNETCKKEYPETVHAVTLTHDFEMQTTEVTQGWFQTLMGYNPSFFSACGTSCPVDQVTWHEAVAYCNTLSKQKGLALCYGCTGSPQNPTCTVAAAYAKQKIYDCPGYRLPTEAEWEHAYRAGTTTSFYNGPLKSCTDEDTTASMIGWYGFNSSDKTHPVGQKKANAWGLFDMAGNVCEWCHDWFQNDLGSAVVTDPWGAGASGTIPVRGGHWRDHPRNVRAPARTDDLPDWKGWENGFRCVRSLP